MTCLLFWLVGSSFLFNCAGVSDYHPSVAVAVVVVVLLLFTMRMKMRMGMGLRMRMTMRCCVHGYSSLDFLALLLLLLNSQLPPDPSLSRVSLRSLLRECVRSRVWTPMDTLSAKRSSCQLYHLSSCMCAFNILQGGHALEVWCGKLDATPCVLGCVVLKHVQLYCFPSM